MEGVNKMNRILFLCVVVMGVSFSFNLKAETVLYCQSELHTGFIKKGGKWRTSEFKLNRYTIKFNNDYSLQLLTELEKILEKQWEVKKSQ